MRDRVPTLANRGVNPEKSPAYPSCLTIVRKRVNVRFEDADAALVMAPASAAAWRRVLITSKGLVTVAAICFVLKRLGSHLRQYRGQSHQPEVTGRPEGR